ncbi:molybdopterin converting factor, subunit 1 [Sphingomonas sp. S17]|jgi:molybdopterin synthase sulfur carrier subunit|uniref:Molybdopterin synthase sulfur carrier subunit n=2 Tax=Sphingomonas paucimobilis TaxID=13689 RepID=A0A411LFG3_SPHPI|nr:MULTISPECIES: molybdopterin converting factor subunit 1 [Sphingomonas]EGI56725.1 molybdopterin converting factor, subunit 1 [Sphingomonas sp. S17]MBQ1479891.1 molybdopterin converting factor subunit 1 [Sphingomonas sp.]MCM3679208.1 molybdopterin converting factor subunit 1 [Sphingomonas paucimobilis]MDG5971962.1 molybdopterin converting factor subunit 1 [Sphingomonas paucimobilis]NNG58030.1 molybdopterin converting factor subunit 1 [Sphingomonas paucimobilis]
MRLTILYFAWVRERIGQAEDVVTIPPELVTIADLITWLAARGGGYAEAMAAPERLRAAIDQNFVGLDALLAGAREVAIFPPVTGG